MKKRGFSFYRKMTGIILTCVMLAGLLPGMTMTALANSYDKDSDELYLGVVLEKSDTVNINGENISFLKEVQYSVQNAGTGVISTDNYAPVTASITVDESGNLKPEGTGWSEGSTILLPEGDNAWKVCYSIDAFEIDPIHIIYHDNIAFLPWDFDDSLPEEEGNFYLTKDVQADDDLSVNSFSIKLFLNGKTISHNQGGNINVSNAELNIYEGSSGSGQICNTVVQQGGAFNLYGGTCNGVTVEGGAFNLYGGTCNGVTVAGGTLTISGGTVTGNTGYGVYNNGGTLNVQGTPMITGNGKNVCLYGENTKINITGALTANGKNAQIGVSKVKNSSGQDVTVTGEFTSGYSIYNSGVDPSTYFISDDPDYGVTLSANGEAQLVPVYSVKITPGSNMSKTETSGAEEQTGLTGAMTTIIYKAVSGYHFEEFTDITDNGIKAVRTDDTTVTVSGTPSGNAKIKIPDAVAIPATLIPVEITATNKEVTYSEDGISIPVEGMFAIPDTAGAAVYSLEGGSGGGSLENGNMLIVYKCGTFIITVETAENAPYAAGTATATLTVEKAGVSVIEYPTSRDLKYTGTAQKLVAEGTVVGGTIYYALGSDDEKAPADDADEWSTEIPAGTAAGTYCVWYEVRGDAKHKDIAPAFVTVTIEKADPTYTAPTANTLTYNRRSQKLVTAGTAKGGTMYYALGKDDKTAPADDAAVWRTSVPKGINAGTYYVWYKVVGDANHKDIAPAFVTVTVISSYDDDDSNIVIQGNTEFENSDPDSGILGADTQVINRQLEEIAAADTTPVGGDQIKKVNVQAKIKIGFEEVPEGKRIKWKAKKPPKSVDVLSITIDNTLFTYDLDGNGIKKLVSQEQYSMSETKVLDIPIYMEGIADSDTICVFRQHNGEIQSFKRIYSKKAKIDGTFYVEFDVETGTATIHIYSGRFSTFVIVVYDGNTDQSSITKEPAAKDLTYTGTALELVTEGSTEDGTMQYAPGTDAATVPDAGWSTYIPEGTDAGIYYVWYKAAGGESGTDTDPECVMAVIKPKYINGAVIEGQIQYASGQLTSVNIESITLPDGTVLSEGDYESEEVYDTEAGKYILTVTGTGNYTGYTELLLDSYYPGKDGFERINYSPEWKGLQGWYHDGYGWQYYDQYSTLLKETWLYWNENWYYLDADGYMYTGWLLYKDSWYYMNPSGKMAMGWVNDGSWYYMDPTGEMATGWVYDGNAWYYMDPTGEMATGWVYDGSWYYMDPTGEMATGWIQDGAYWYYLDINTGAMATGECLVDGIWYLFGEDGTWIE